MTPSTITSVLPALLSARRPVAIWGAAGVGKSSLIRQYADKHKLQLRDVRLSQLDSIDLRGFPVPDAKTKSMSWLPADFLPKKDDPPGILFLDEINGALPATAAAAYQLILDFRIGSYELPDHWNIVAAGNRLSDRGVTHQLPAPLNNRFIHIDYTLDADEWQRRAAADGIHPHVRAYLKFKPASLYEFDSAKNPRSFPTPRSWYFTDAIYKCQYPTSTLLELVTGTVGEGHAAEFVGFVRDIARMPDIDDIVKNPRTAPLPDGPAVTHAVVTTLNDRATKKNFDSLMQYIQRLAKEYQVVFVRNALEKDDAVTDTAAFVNWGMANQGLLAR